MAELSTLADGVMFFPVTAFDASDRVDAAEVHAHVASALQHSPAAVFPACGTGEFHALSASEHRVVVEAAVRAVGGAVPVVAGAGGPLGHAREVAAGAAEAGADALLVLPPYLVSGTQAGLVSYVEAIAAASELPLVVYHRGSAALTPDSVARLVELPSVVGIKDGVGDVALAQRFVRIAAASGRDILFFNGLLTAELSQAAYRAIGVPHYSSAVFAMAPEIATAFYRAYRDGDDATRGLLLDEFFIPLVALRDEVPGFAVSLIKAGLRLAGRPVGSVRPPLTDPAPDQLERLDRLLRRGRELVA